jgi:hypothetical protein
MVVKIAMLMRGRQPINALLKSKIKAIIYHRTQVSMKFKYILLQIKHPKIKEISIIIDSEPAINNFYNAVFKHLDKQELTGVRDNIKKLGDFIETTGAKIAGIPGQHQSSIMQINQDTLAMVNATTGSLKNMPDKTEIGVEFIGTGDIQKITGKYFATPDAVDFKQLKIKSESPLNKLESFGGEKIMKSKLSLSMLDKSGGIFKKYLKKTGSHIKIPSGTSGFEHFAQSGKITNEELLQMAMETQEKYNKINALFNSSAVKVEVFLAIKLDLMGLVDLQADLQKFKDVGIHNVETLFNTDIKPEDIELTQEVNFAKLAIHLNQLKF